jgi:hypothetical protein
MPCGQLVCRMGMNEWVVSIVLLPRASSWCDAMGVTRLDNRLAGLALCVSVLSYPRFVRVRVWLRRLLLCLRLLYYSYV